MIRCIELNLLLDLPSPSLRSLGWSVYNTIYPRLSGQTLCICYNWQLHHWVTTNHSKFIPTSPTSCLSSSSTLGELVTCFEYFTVRPNHYNKTTYEAAQPTSQQRHDWRILIMIFLSAHEHCTSMLIPDSFKQLYAIERFYDMCVLYETSIKGGVYTKGWGFMIVPLWCTSVSRTVHFSAPHPVHEPGTVQQAASLFQSTGSQSLFVAGRHRNVFLKFTNCIGPKKYYETDPMHNDVITFL